MGSESEVIYIVTSILRLSVELLDIWTILGFELL